MKPPVPTKKQILDHREHEKYWTKFKQDVLHFNVQSFDRTKKVEVRDSPKKIILIEIIL